MERRTVSGETPAGVLAEFEAILARLAAADSTFHATARLVFSRDPFGIDAGAPIARTVADAAEAVLGRAPALVGQTAWTDAAILQAAGIPTVLFGNTGGGWHSIDEWVEAESVVQCARVLIETARQWCGE